jgi:outer membrane immunogenic protein
MMIRKTFLLAVAVAALTSGALAADLPFRQPPPIYVPPLFTWTGLYLGAQIGYAWGTNNTSLPTVPAFTGSNLSGVTGGVHVGYNYQVNQIVIGIEGEGNGTSFSKSAFEPITGTIINTSILIEGSIRGRIGVAWDRVLLYATGGVALADVHNSYFGGIATSPYSSSDIVNSRVGWIAGAGVEYAMINNLSVRAEYRYADLGHQTNSVMLTGIPATNHLTENAVRVGVSYKVDLNPPPAPVVAKY